MSVETFIQLKYFSPFNIDNIPYDVLKEVHIAAFGYEYEHRQGKHWPVPQTPITLVLERETDGYELQHGIKKILLQRAEHEHLR